MPSSEREGFDHRGAVLNVTSGLTDEGSAVELEITCRCEQIIVTALSVHEAKRLAKSLIAHAERADTLSDVKGTA